MDEDPLSGKYRADVLSAPFLPRALLLSPGDSAFRSTVSVRCHSPQRAACFTPGAHSMFSTLNLKAAGVAFVATVLLIISLALVVPYMLWSLKGHDQ